MNILNRMKIQNIRKIGNSKDKKQMTIFGVTLASLDITAMLVPVIVIIWSNSGLSFGQFLLLQGIFTLTVMIFEVPSGALSDSWLGRKKTQVIALALHSISMFTMAVADTFILFALAEIVAGISMAMKSGNATALLYDSLAEHNEVESFNDHLSRIMTLRFIAASLANIIGGILGTIAIRLPLIALGIIYTGITLMFCLVEEPDRVRAKNAVDATKQATWSILTKPVLVILVIYTIAPATLSTIVFWSYQPLMIELGNFGPTEIGITMASFNIIAAVGSKSITYLDDNYNIINNLWALSALMVLSTISTYMIAIAGNILVLLGAIYVIQLVRGISNSYFLIAQQNHLKSSERSTFNSIDSLKNSILYSIIATSQNGHSVQYVLNLAVIGYIVVTGLTMVATLLLRHNLNQIINQDSSVSQPVG